MSSDTSLESLVRKGVGSNPTLINIFFCLFVRSMYAGFGRGSGGAAKFCVRKGPLEARAVVVRKRSFFGGEWRKCGVRFVGD